MSTALQVAFARYDASKIVLIDRSDILDAAGRNGLIRALLKMNIAAILGMTIDSIDKVPNLAGVGGRAYWISDCVAQEIKGGMNV
jgi:hypothetical protein